MSNWLQSRQVRAGGYSGAYILVFVAILAGVNFLADQYNKTFDATKDKLYSLSDQTHKILGDLKNDVTIYYFDQKSRFPAATNSLVRYQNASNHVSIKYIDPESDIGTAQAMNVRNFGTVVVEMGANRQEAPTTGEEDVTNAIIKLIKGGHKKACIVSGHGEADASSSEREGFSGAQTEIRNANYEVGTISLAETGEVPSDCTVVIVAGPSADYFEPEVEALRKFVDAGGRVLLMLDAVVEGETHDAALVQLAAEWGAQVNSDVIIDPSPVGQLFGGGPLTPMITDYDTTHAITKVMGNVAALFPMARSVTKAESTGKWTDTELMKTTAQSFATTAFQIADGELVRKPEAETQGPLNVAVAGTMDIPKPAEAAPVEEKKEGEEIPKPAENEDKQARVVVTGSSRFARNAAFGRGGNADLFLNMLSWLSSDEDLISIRPKDPANTPMDISQSKMSWIFFGLVLGLPLAIVVAGVRTWWVRR